MFILEHKPTRNGKWRAINRNTYATEAEAIEASRFYDEDGLPLQGNSGPMRVTEIA